MNDSEWRGGGGKGEEAGERRMRVTTILRWTVLVAASIALNTISGAKAAEAKQLRTSSFIYQSSSMFASSTQSQLDAGVNLEQEGALSIQLALVSVRGSLAFWRQSEQQSNSELPDQTSYFGQKKSGRGKCAHSPAQSQLRSDIVAVEGANIRLNLVLVGHRLANQQVVGAQRRPDAKLTYKWTLNGEPIAQNANRAKFSQHLINENDIMRQYFASKPLANQFHTNNNSSKQIYQMSSQLQSANELMADFSQSFMLAPFANERLLSKAEANLLQLDSKQPLNLSRLRIHWLKLLDDFLADGSAIDWPKLEAFLRQNAAQLRLSYLAASESFQQQSVDNNASAISDCHASLEQLSIVQVELNQLSRHDHGLYRLEVCQGSKDPIECQQISFALHLALDVPNFESKPQNQILEPGERLSMKCEATAFTLPQISWFLDGKQLNEHLIANQRPSSTQHSSSSSSFVIVNQRFRIGDYVSQDNHVHSFVNSSSIQVSDGGFYKCQANNGFHSIEHEARVDVRGPAQIARHLANVSALLGQTQIHLQCPYSGYPIASIEWYQRPLARATPTAEEAPSASGQLRAKRRPAEAALLPADPDEEPEQDEWLAQATAMSPPTPEDYPEPMPDYPAPGLVGVAPGYSAYESLGEPNELLLADYSEDLQQQSRKRRDIVQDAGDWLKLPQSRRHQIHANGSLIIQDISLADQGSYKCRAVASLSASNSAGAASDDSGSQQAEDESWPSAATSNDFHLTVLVAPVISPFNSAESLREGMRNFLTCSVIEGDSPVKLQWLKDQQPIEQYMQSMSSLSGSNWLQPQQQQLARIRVEASNEYTSTLYFSHVDFKDNANYTCMATNKAASVNYTTRMLVNVPPKWIKAPKDLECVAGQNIVIDCQAEAHPSARVWWEIGVYSQADLHHQPMKPQQLEKAKQVSGLSQVSEAALAAPIGPTSHVTQLQHYAPNHYRTIISNSRIHILENASLVIRDVHKQDQGYYLCQAANNFGSLSSLIKITVNVGASFSSKYLMKYVKLNEHIELDCDPIGQSPIELVWYMRHSQTSPTSSSNQLNHTSSLIIGQSPSSTQSPSFTNQSSMMIMQQQQQQQQQNNNNNQPQNAGLGRRLFIGTIRGSETVQANHHQQSAESSSKKRAELEQFDPAQLVDSAWSGSMSFELARKSDGQGELVRLIIKQAQRSHSADFICQASNRFGGEEKLVKLVVQEPPDPVQEMSVVQVNSRWVSLSWLAPFNGNSPISSYTVEWAPVKQLGGSDWSHVITQQPSVTLTSLQSSTSYEIRVRAHNQFGHSPNAISAPPMLVTTLEEAPSSPPSDIKVLALSSASLQISWLPPTIQMTLDAENNVESATEAKQKRYSIKGYYLGYKLANSNESFVFKTVSLMSDNLLSGNENHLLAMPEYQPARQNSSFPIKNNATTSNDPSHRLRVVIGDLKRSSKYAILVQAFNSAGPGPQSDQIEAKTLANDPPPAPLLRIGMVTYSSIELLWSFQIDPIASSKLLQASSNSTRDNSSQGSSGEPRETFVDGYHLYYKSSEGQWMERKMMPETHSIIASNHQKSDLSIVDWSQNASDKTMQQSGNRLESWHKNSSSLVFKSFRFILDQLSCGNSYQIYLIAYNSIGAGLPSQILRTKTRGSAPIGPRKQDFILLNSTFIQLNFDSWQDGGCSIINFEIRYKQLHGRTGSSSMNKEGDLASQWLLLSSNINPEQRMIELRDLQPETWYSLLTTAESAGGKTEVQYSFMTLDKFGQMPIEAIESSNLPALFRSGNGSIRSILFNFSSPNSVSPLIISACLCLILFATCSLFLIRRYNIMMKDNASVDSQATSGPLSSHYHHGQMSDTLDAHSKLMNANVTYGSHNHQQEHYSMKASPCKTATTILTGSSTNGSNGPMISSSLLCNDGSNLYGRRDGDQSVDLSQFINTSDANNDHHHCSHPQYQLSSNLAHQSQDECCSPSISPSKFATLSSRDNNFDAQHQLGRFKTMPHRPVSSFIPNANNYNQQTLSSNDAARYLFNGSQQQSHNDYQQQLADQQQIYSKLRLIYNSNSNYNLCSEAQKGVQSDTNQQIYNGDQIDLAVLAQQNQKMLACTLKRNVQQQQPQQSLYVANNVCARPEGNPNNLTSLLMDCQQQHHSQVVDSSIENTNNYGQYQTNHQVINESIPIDQAQLQSNGYNGYGAQSIASGSTSTTNSTQPTTSSSISNNTTEQLINLANGNGSSLNQAQNLCSKTNQMSAKINGRCLETNQQQNMAQQQVGQQPTNEQNDYALPFPPKWV